MVSSICFVVALGGKYGAKAGGSVTETRRPGCFEVDKPPPLNMDLIWEASSLPSSKAARSFFPFAVEIEALPSEITDRCTPEGYGPPRS